MKRLLLLFITAVVITVITPRRALIDLSVNTGDIWNEATLIAPFDVPLIKSQNMIEREQDEITQNFRPIFRLDTTTIKRKIALLITLINSEVNVDSITTTLNKIYHKGIMPVTEWSKYKDRVIRVCDASNELEFYPVAELYSPEKALTYLENMGVNQPHILTYLTPNLTYDAKLNKSILQDELYNISTTRSMVRTGETLVNNGQIVDENTSDILNSFRLEYETQIGMKDNFYILLIGRFIMILTLLIVNYVFFTRFASHYFGDGLNQWIFIFMIYVGLAALTSVAVHMDSVSPYVVPMAIVPIYMMNYFNMRVAIFGNLSVAIIGALFVRIPFDFFFVNFIAGMVAIFMMRHHYHRNNLFQALGAILLAEVVCYISVQLLRLSDFATIDYITLLWFVGNTFLILGLYQAVYLIERIFGFVSDVTLLELCDTNQTLLLQLAEKAPGTFQHSVQVANLAEAAAKEIGANPLLARTGAMYHDIGKMENPFYFVENLSGEFNPHNDLTPIESADYIRQHVIDGVAIAKKNRLPKQIIDFITGHHGTSKMYYFYAAQMKKDGKIDDESLFSYPGPTPVSKEVAICMMSDAVEAASRSLPSYEKESLEALVDKIVDIQISERQLSACELSFNEVEQVKALFKAKLNTIYHARISYPERMKTK